jgi:hypothetical protein
MLRQPDDYLINVRDTDAIMEEYGLTEDETAHMENQLKIAGRFWLTADILLMPVKLK